MGPTRAGFAVCDVLSGMTAAFAVSSALFQRTHTGKGQFIDVSMLEASLAFLSTQVADFTVAGHRQEQFGNQAISRKVTANLFRAKDSYLLLAVNDEKQFRALMTALGRADVLDDPRFGDWFLRKENEAALRAIIEAALAAADAKAWETRLNAAGAPCASIWRIEEIIDHPQIVARGVMQTAETRVWAVAADGLGVPDGAWRGQAGQRAAGAGGAHGCRAGGAGVWRGRDRRAARGQGGVARIQGDGNHRVPLSLRGA